MNTTVLPFFGVTPPEAGEPVSWVIDLQGTPPTRSGYEAEAYPPASMWTRMAMGRSRMPTEKALKRIERWLWNRETDIRELTHTADLPHDQDADIARVLLVRATLIEIGSSLVIVTVWPTGYAEMWTWRAEGTDYHASYFWNHINGEWEPTPALDDGEGE